MMNIQTLDSGKDGVLKALKKNTQYLVVELTSNIKVDTQPPAKFATVTRQLVVLEETLPIEVKDFSAKPQGE